MTSNAESPAPFEGLFAGKYRLLRMLGKGAMGEVWLAEEEGPRNFRRKVAVKRLISASDISDIATTSFVAEAQVVAKLDHHNIVRLIELGTFEGELYLVLDFVDGASLDRIIKRKLGGGPLSPAAVALIGREIALALESVHSLCDENGKNYGVVHRDVTPSNILISRDGRVRLADFGVARISGFAGDKTETGIFKGKLPYMPPEQARGEPFDGRADVYALGTTLFEALLGQRPRKAETQTQLIMMIATERCPLVHSLIPSCPPALAAAIDSATEMDVNKRVGDAGMLASSLDIALRQMGPNAIREAKEELKARVATVAGPIPTSSTASRAKAMIDSDHSSDHSKVGRRDSWSVSLHTQNPADMQAVPPPEPSSPSSPSAIVSSSNPSSQTLIAGQSPPASSVQPRASTRSIVIASLIGLVSAATVTTLLLVKGKPESNGPAGLPGDKSDKTEQVNAGPSSQAQTQNGNAATPSAADTAEAAAPKASGESTAGSGENKPQGKDPKGKEPKSGSPSDGRTKTKPEDTASGNTASDIDPNTPGTLTVIVVPWGEVSVDGKGYGATPLPPISLAPGPHSVSVKNPELGASRGAGVTIKPGQGSSVKFDLRKTE